MDFLIPLLIFIVYRMVFLTVRVREVNVPDVMLTALEQKKPLLFAHWHGDEWQLMHLWGRRHVTVMVSHSRQGTRVGRLVGWMGFNVLRGSSSKGGAMGLRSLVQAAQEGHLCSLAVDGPRGPLHVAKPGVIQLARLTGLPIVPLVAVCSRPIVLKRAWNQAILPKPFSRVVICYGPPVFVKREGSEEEIERARQFLEQELKKLKSTAAEII